MAPRRASHAVAEGRLGSTSTPSCSATTARCGPGRTQVATGGASGSAEGTDHGACPPAPGPPAAAAAAGALPPPEARSRTAVAAATRPRCRCKKGGAHAGWRRRRRRASESDMGTHPSLASFVSPPLSSLSPPLPSPPSPLPLPPLLPSHLQVLCVVDEQAAQLLTKARVRGELSADAPGHRKRPVPVSNRLEVDVAPAASPWAALLLLLRPVRPAHASDGDDGHAHRSHEDRVAVRKRCQRLRGLLARGGGGGGGGCRAGKGGEAGEGA